MSNNTHQRAFQLFEPGHLMVHWIKFLQVFVQYRYEEALGYAKQFVTNWRQPPFPLLFKIGDTGTSLVGLKIFVANLRQIGLNDGCVKKVNSP
jgi:hypothetical protein